MRQIEGRIRQITLGARDIVFRQPLRPFQPSDAAIAKGLIAHARNEKDGRPSWLPIWGSSSSDLALREEEEREAAGFTIAGDRPWI